MAQAKPSVVFDAAYYQKHMPSQIAAAQAQQLGITTDQLYQMYGAYAGNRPPPPAPGGQGAVGATGQTAAPGSQGAVGAAGQATGPSPFGGAGAGYGAWSTPVTNRYQTGAQSFQGSPAYNWIQDQVQTGVGQNILNPPQQQQAAPQFQQPQLNPNPTIRLAPTAPLPVQPTAPPPTQPIFQQAAQIPQQAPASTQPIISNVLNPIPVPMQPVQQFQGGGLVTQSGSNQQQPAPANFYGTAYGGLYGMNAQGNPTGQPSYANPTDLAGLLGAAALQTPYVQNVTPSGTPSSKSGVAPVGGAMIGTTVPQVTPSWDWVAHNAGLSSSQIAAFSAQGLTPNDVAQKFNVSAGPLTGPWTTQPGVFARATPPAPTAAPTVTPQTPATAVPYTPGVAFATPPSAPGYTLGSTLPPTMAQSGATTATPPTAMLPPGFMGGAQGAGYVPQAFLQAHTSALADAGKALYSHFGGDPNSASPADIANFHNQLTGAVSQHLAANQPATGVKQAATGGLVPGRGNEDTVPALLTPGEYVIPKHQVAQLAAGGTLKFDKGGEVPEYISPTNEAALAAQAGTSGGKSATQTGRRTGAPTTPSTVDALRAQPATIGDVIDMQQKATPVTPYPTTGLAPGETGYVTSGEPNWLQRAGQTIGHFFTGTLGQDPYQRGTWQYGPQTVNSMMPQTVGDLITQPGRTISLGRLPVSAPPQRMQSGGFVDEPPEARRQALTVQSGNAPAGSQPSSSSAQTSSPQVPTGGSSLVSGLAQAAHTYGNAFSSIGTTAYQAPAGSNAMTVGQFGSGPAPGAGQTMSLGKLPAAGGGGGMQSALGGIGSGLTQAAQAIAASVKPWTPQQSAIPDPSQLPKYQIPTLQPERVG